MARPGPDGGKAAGSKPSGTTSTPNPNTSTAVGTAGYDPETFAVAVLQKMGLPTTQQNIDFFTSWEAAEGGNWNNSASFNPLNTTLHLAGSGPMGNNPNQNGGNPVQAYQSWDDGINATVQTLSHSRYSGIIAALKSSDPQSAAQAVLASGWGTSSITLGSGATYTKQAGYSTGPVQTKNAVGANTQTTLTGQQVQGTPDQLANQFGYSTAFFNSDPSLKALINSYAGQDATNSQVQARFKADLMDTAWYKKHTAAQREWTQLQTSDPTEAAHQLLLMQQTLAAQAKQSGVPLSAGQLHKMASDALNMYGQNVPSNVVSEMIGAQLHYKGTGTYTGDVGNSVQTLKDLATSYGVPLSDNTLGAWLQNIVQNGVDPKSYTSYLQKQAESMYPTLAPELKNGLTFQQAVDPYRQTAAQLTEMDPNKIDFTQAKWQRALTQIDPKTGARTAMSLSDWQQTLKSDPIYGYANTQAGKQEQAGLATTIAQMFGALG